MQGQNACQYVTGSAAGYVDDENSQAEGISDGVAPPTINSNNNNNNNSGHQVALQAAAHYENLYESVEPYHAEAVGPALINCQQPQQQQPSLINQPPLAAVNAPQLAAPHPYHPLAYRNEMYDRNPAYDVPRGRVAGRRFLHIPPTGQRRQRSFDDTESYQYVNVNGTYSDYSRYENTYERVREEPEYQNTGRMTYGQMDVIGHGIGRIERHLSSSCGNIDHYSLGKFINLDHKNYLGNIRWEHVIRNLGTMGLLDSLKNLEYFNF